MDTIITLTAEPRKVLGRKVNKLRSEGILPVNVYGKKIESTPFSVKLSDFLEVYKKAGETSLLNLIVAGKGKKDERAVLISNVQTNPVTDTPIHVDFRQVDLKEKVTAEVPVELTGESPAEKQGVGTVVQYIDKVQVEALPTDLPEKFIIDVSNLSEVDQSVLVKDIKIEKDKVKILLPSESIVTKVEPPQKEEEVAPAPTAEVPAEGVPVAEGETPQGEAQTGSTPADEAPNATTGKKE